MLLILSACDSPPPADTAAHAELGLTVQVTQPGEPPVRVVRWTTTEPSTGRVEYGPDDAEPLDHVLTDDTPATEHEVVLAALAAGQGYQLRVVAQVGDEELQGERLALEPVYAPTDLEPPTLSFPPPDTVQGFELIPVTSGAYARPVLLDAWARPVWWGEAEISGVFRARWEPSTQRVSWVVRDGAASGTLLVSQALTGERSEQWVEPTGHQDFVAFPDGGVALLTYEEQRFGEQVVRGERLLEVAPDGSTRALWSSWDTFAWTSGGMKKDDGVLEWPHATSLGYDAERRKVLVALYYTDAIVQIDRDTATVDWVLGGEDSDWTVQGEGFEAPHGPHLSPDGRQLAVLDQGRPTPGVPAVARAVVYDLDADALVASERWSFDDGGAHTVVALGNVNLIDDASVLVNWGSAGLLQRVDAGGALHWEAAFGLGALAEYNEHVPDLGGVTR